MARAVLLTDDAAEDLDEIGGYVARQDSPARAAHVLERIAAVIAAVIAAPAEAPDRGPVPAELAALGIRTYREVFYKPYRIVYRVQPDAVIVLLIADGRRDLQTLLQRRLLDA
jgi:toxin ParE1/3/4